MIGVGCAPIYPSLLHETPVNYGADVSQSIMGMQMACAYGGSTLMPPLFGAIVGLIDIKVFPFYLAIFVFTMFVMVEGVNKLLNKI